MTRSEQYRRTGEDYLQMADNCRYSEQRTLWVTLAQAWFKLADDSDEFAARAGGAESPPIAGYQEPAGADGQASR